MDLVNDPTDHMVHSGGALTDLVYKQLIESSSFLKEKNISTGYESTLPTALDKLESAKIEYAQNKINTYQKWLNNDVKYKRPLNAHNLQRVNEGKLELQKAEELRRARLQQQGGGANPSAFLNSLLPGARNPQLFAGGSTFVGVPFQNDVIDAILEKGVTGLPKTVVTDSYLQKVLDPHTPVDITFKSPQPVPLPKVPEPSWLSKFGPYLADFAGQLGGNAIGNVIAKKRNRTGEYVGLGSQFGAVLGSAFGPAGTILGGLAGGAIGGLFGPGINPNIVLNHLEGIEFNTREQISVIEQSTDKLLKPPAGIYNLPTDFRGVPNYAPQFASGLVGGSNSTVNHIAIDVRVTGGAGTRDIERAVETAVTNALDAGRNTSGRSLRKV
jgi:hypothetical protein